MYNTASAREVFWLSMALPEDIFFSIDEGQISIQARTMQRVREVTRLFPGTFWKKAREEDCGWWTYRGMYGSIGIKIYAIYETPPSCSVTYEEVEVEEKVPVAFETIVVKRKVAKWECGKLAQ